MVEQLSDAPILGELFNAGGHERGICWDGWTGPVGNAFCPTGEGGGVDPSCSPGGAHVSDSASPRAHKALEQLNAHLKMGVALGADAFNMDPKAKYHTAIEYVLAKGQDFVGGEPLPEGTEKGVLKECYQNASMLVMKDKNLRYAEGFAQREGLLPVLHAWAVTKDNKVIDNTWPDTEHAAYKGVVYPRGAYLKHLYKKKFYGLLGGRDEDARQILHDGGLPAPKSRGKKP